MKICVYGAGAIGGHLAGRLAQAGAEVSVIARGPHLVAIKRDGLCIEAAGGTLTQRLPASDDPAELGPQGLVLVTVKAPALPTVAATIAPLLRPATPVVFIGNGIPWWYGQIEGNPLDPHGALHDAVEPRRVVGGVIYSNCTVIRPGVVQVQSAQNRLILGEPTGRLTQRVTRLATLLRIPPFAAEATAALGDAIWTKLIRNIGSGLLCVLSLHDQRTVFGDPTLIAALRQLSAEAAMIAQACGCAPIVDPDLQIAQASQHDHRPSVLQDLEAGRPMEIEAIFRAPLALARRHGVATPLLDLLVTLVTMRAEAEGLYR